jgi:hypothetical protein
MQQLFLASLGIITEPNKIASTQPGSLTELSYPLVCRSPGVVEAAPNWTTALTVSTLNRSYVFSVDKYVLVVSNRSSDNLWFVRWFDTSTNTVSFNIQMTGPLGTPDTMDPFGRFGAVTVRDRTILLASNSPLVFDYINPATTAQAFMRMPGLQTPNISSVSEADPGTGSALENNKHTSLTAVIRRIFSDGYELFSAPSGASWFSEIALVSGLTNMQVTVNFDGSQAVVGDVVEIYRTKSQAYTGSTGTNVGGDYFLSMSVTLTATDITNEFVSIVDKIPDSSLGEALYTNTGVSGGNAMALNPPSAKSIAYYRGHTFYNNYTQGSVWNLRVGSFWGTMGTSASGVPAGPRKSGIGQRAAVGTSALGSPTITGVSAGDIAGIVIGQFYLSPNFLNSARVTAVGATTITLSSNATIAGSANHFIYDVVEITYSGSTVLYNMSSLPLFYNSLAGLTVNYGKFSFTGLGIILSTPYGSGSLQPIPAEDISVFLRYLDGATSNSSFSVRATNGWNYVPQLPRIELGETARTFASTTTKNGVAWSEKDEPEYFCGTNVDNVGGGEVLAVAATRDALWYFCTDGVFRWSGTGGSVADGYDWRLDPIDKTFVIAGPQAYCVLRDHVYAYGNRGFIRIDSAGNVTEISAGRCDDVMPGRTWIGLAYTGNAALQQLDGPNGYYLVADDKNNEVILKKKDLDFTGFIWIYNAHQDCVTRDAPNSIGGLSPDHGVWNESAAKIYHACTDTGTNVLTIRANSGVVATGSTYTFQPAVTDDPFTMRQFQRVEVVFDVASNPQNVSVTCRFNDNTSLDQTRFFPSASTSSSGPSVNNRLSFIVPRNAPAVANTIKITLVVGGSSLAYIRLLGVALKYSTPTEQRKAR